MFPIFGSLLALLMAVTAVLVRVNHAYISAALFGNNII